MPQEQRASDHFEAKRSGIMFIDNRRNHNRQNNRDMDEDATLQMLEKTLAMAEKSLNQSGSDAHEMFFMKKEDKVDESGQASSDSRQAISENDASIDDINKTVSDYPLMHGRTSGSAQSAATICGLSVDTTGSYMGTIKLNYNGTSCNNRARTG